MNNKKRINLNTLVKIWLIVSAGCLVIFHAYILGDLTVAFFDVGTDGKDQYIMWYNGIVNSLRDGNFSAWDLRNGFGINTMGHHLTEPFLIPVFILGYLFGPEHITGYMVWVEIFRILVAATVFYWYLSEFSFTENSKLIVTLMYSFNAYMMVWGQHYALGSSLVFFPVILLFAERVIRKVRFSAVLSLICCITMMSSFYQGYMCMLGGGAYVCIRLLMLEDVRWKERGKAFLIAAGTMILGVVMSSVRFLPSAAAQIGSSARLEATTSLADRLLGLRIWPMGLYKTIVYRLFSSCIQGNGNALYAGQTSFPQEFVGQRNFYEDPNLFFSTLFIILLVQYLFLLPRWKESRKKKLMQYLITGLCVLTVMLPNVTTLFNGLFKPFFRHTFVLMPVFGVMSAKVLDHIWEEKKISVIGLVVTLLGCSGIYLKAYRIFPDLQFETDAILQFENNAMILWITTIAMILLLFCFCRGYWKDSQAAYLLLVLLVFINVVSDSWLCYNERVALSKKHPEYYAQTYHSDVDAALAWIAEQDPTLYRVEKDYFTASSCFDSLAQDYRGISAYNSNQNENILKFVEEIWPQLNHERDVNHIQFQNAIWDNTLAALTDVKYVLSRSDDMNLKGYRKINQIGAVSIYQNENTASFGKFYTDLMTEQQFEEQKSLLNTRKLLKEVLIVPEGTGETLSDAELSVYEKEEIDDILLEDTEDAYEQAADAAEDRLPFVITCNLNEKVLSEYKDVIFQFTMNAEKRTVVEVTIDDGYTHSFVQNKDESREICIEIPQDAGKVVLNVKDPSGYVRIDHLHFYGTKEESKFNDQAEIVVNAPEKDSELTGHIRTEQSGYVLLPVSNEKGWNVWLNGEKQEIARGDYGFIAFSVEPGEYDLRVRFTAPLLREGMWISILGAVLFVAVTMLSRRKNKEKDHEN